MTPEDLAKAKRLLPPLPYDFDYAKDDFALHILARQVGNGRTARQIKASPVAGLLAKAQHAVRGNGVLDQTDCAQALARSESQIFPMTTRAWGNNPGPKYDRFYYQTARQGFNLVLQLGLPEPFWRDFRALCKPNMRDPYNSDWHPARKSGPPTLAWARIDLDWTTKEALIEELQSDWVTLGEDDRRDEWVSQYAFDGQEERVLTYLRHVLPSVETLWSEALLWLSIHILTRHLRLQRIFLYDHDTGNKTKAYPGGSVGPRSLYEKLPKRFGFLKEAGTPAFLKDTYATPEFEKRFEGSEPHFWRLPTRGELIPR
ncbi:MAG: hypothetical protein AAF337_06860 [Pseudomonadota bacterium]